MKRDIIVSILMLTVFRWYASDYEIHASKTVLRQAFGWKV